MSLPRLNRLVCATRACPFKPTSLYPPVACYPSTTATATLQRFLSSAGQMEPLPATKTVVHTTNKKPSTHVKKVSSKLGSTTDVPASTKVSDSSKQTATVGAVCLVTGSPVEIAMEVTETEESSTELQPTPDALRTETCDGKKSSRDARRSIPKFSPEDMPKALTKQRYIELSKHMLDLYLNIIPSEQDVNRLNSFVSGVRNCMRQKFGDSVDIQVFGSAASDLWMGSDSDVDLSLVFQTKIGKKQQDLNVYKMARALFNGNYSDIWPISRASVPIVKFLDPKTNISSDVNIMNKLGIKNTDMIREYCNFDDRIKPFVYLIKWFVKRRNLNNPSQDGTPSSYCHVMMALHYLQVRNPPILPSFQKIAEIKGQTDWVQVSPEEYSMGLRRLVSAPTRTVAQWSNCAYSDDVRCSEAAFNPDKKAKLAELLYGFFMHYGYDFDFENEVVSLRLGRRASKEELCFDADALAVEDPFLLWKNLLASATNVTCDRLKKEYRQAAYLLSNAPATEAVEQLMAHLAPNVKPKPKRTKGSPPRDPAR